VLWRKIPDNAGVAFAPRDSPWDIPTCLDDADSWWSLPSARPKSSTGTTSSACHQALDAPSTEPEVISHVKNILLGSLILSNIAVFNLEILFFIINCTTNCARSSFKHTRISAYLVHSRIPHMSGSQVANTSRLYHGSGWRRRRKRRCRFRTAYAQRSSAKIVPHGIGGRMPPSIRILSSHRLLIFFISLLKIHRSLSSM